MTQRFEITIKFTVDKDMVPGMFHKAEDWVEFITREYMRQTHYNACYEVESVVEYDPDDMKFVALPMVEKEQTYAEAPWLRSAWDGYEQIPTPKKPSTVSLLWNRLFK